jgi:hypothetical protein
MPVYELWPDNGLPYNDILELRRDKIVNWILELSLLQRLNGYLAVRYEDMVNMGTRLMLEQVADMLGFSELPPECNPQPPRSERLRKRQKWIEEHLNKDTEKLLGYR